jgi:hypothetical protein
MAAKTKAEKEAEALAAEEARRAALSDEERDAEDAARAQEEADAKIAEDAAKSNETSVTVAYDGTTREYSKAVHGATFKALAEEFAKKRNGKIV